MTVLLIILLGVAGLLRQTKTLSELLTTDWDNKLIRHHISLTEDMEGEKPKDCWICTHSPISSKTMPYLALPLEPQEVLVPDCIHNETWTESRFLGEDVPRDVSATLTIVGWVTKPWFQLNITRPDGYSWWMEYDSDKGIIAKIKTKIPHSGPIPHDGLWFSLQYNGVGNCGKDNNCFYIHTHDSTKDNETVYQKGIEGCTSSFIRRTFRRERGSCISGMTGKQMNNTWCAHKVMKGLLNLLYCVQSQTHFCIFPEGVFLVCGNRAHKWVSPDMRGVCTLARLTPATFIVPHSEVDVAAVPIHTLYKRAADNKPRPNGRPHVVEMGKANKVFSAIFIHPFLMQMWDKLVESTDYLDDHIFRVLEILNATNAIQKQLIVVTNQHTIVLDFVTAKDGGMCQIIGPACCHYIDPAGNLQVRADIQKTSELRDKWLKEHDANKDSWWGNTFSFMNPANWFKGIAGWVSGIIQTCMQILLFCLLLYIAVKTLIYALPKLMNNVCSKSPSIEPSVVYYRPQMASADRE
ncbi:uncharacterized protein ACNLHF_011136 isoform 1-T3 [Anomaloglossus baeobatrachus]|uniref:uncharacterized protein LOC142290194 n=1 Tax=Anomaloglossus baeobatrachus TaxID=238106 RepID=UPI003F4F66EF